LASYGLIHWVCGNTIFLHTIAWKVKNLRNAEVDTWFADAVW